MKKIGCLGCLGCGCLIVVLSVALIGFFGYDFIQSTGSEVLGNVVFYNIKSLSESIFDKKDHEEIMKAANKALENIKSKKVGLFDLIINGTELLANEISLQAYIYAFYKQNTEKSEAYTEVLEPLTDKKIIIDSLIFSIKKGEIPENNIASLTAIMEKNLVSEEIKISTSGTMTTRRFESNFTPEDVAATFVVFKKIIEENKIGKPDTGFDSRKAIKEEIMSFLNKINADHTQESP